MSTAPLPTIDFRPSALREAPRALRWGALVGLGLGLALLPLAAVGSRDTRDVNKIAERFFDAYARMNSGQVKADMTPPLAARFVNFPRLGAVERLPLQFEIQ